MTKAKKRPVITKPKRPRPKRSPSRDQPAPLDISIARTGRYYPGYYDY